MCFLYAPYHLCTLPCLPWKKSSASDLINSSLLRILRMQSLAQVLHAYPLFLLALSFQSFASCVLNLVHSVQVNDQAQKEVLT